MNTYIYILLFFIIFMFHNFIFFTMISKIVDYRVGKLSLFSMILFNTILFTWLFYQFPPYNVTIYILLFIIWAIDALILFKSNPLTSLAAIFTMPIHLIAFRSIYFSIISILNEFSVYDVFNSVNQYWISLIFSSLISSSCVLLLVIIIKESYFRLMGQSPGRVTLFFTFIILTSIRLLINANNLYIDFNYPFFAYENIATSISWLAVIYFGIFILIGIELIENKTIKLQNDISVDKMMKDTLAEKSDMIIEINVSKNSVTSLMRFGKPDRIHENYTYSEIINIFIESEIIAEDRIRIREICSPLYLIRSYENKKYEVNFETEVLLPGAKDYKWYHATYKLTKNVKTKDVYATLFCYNIHEEKTKELNLIDQAQRDNLVGAFNRKTCEKLVRNILDNKSYGTMFVVDLDNFKAINDVFGHHNGDKLLIQIYGLLKEIFRETDIIARFGGDEFVIFIQEEVNLETLEYKAKQICKKLEKTYKYKNSNITVSASVGIASAPFDGQDFDRLFINADRAMYYSKKEGKSTYTFFKDIKKDLSLDLDKIKNTR